MCLFFHLISNNLVMSILMLSHVLSHVTTLKESERLFKKKIQIPNWRLDFYWVRCSGFFLGFFVLFVSFLFLFWFGYKMYIWLSNYKKKTRSYKFLLYVFFRKEWQAVFFNPQLRIHNFNNAYLVIALDNCYYVKIKIDCVYLFLNSSK